MQHNQRPLTDMEQGMLFLWLRTHVPPVEVLLMRERLPEIAFNIFGPPMDHGIPSELFAHVQMLCRANRKLEAIKELRSHMEWGLKEAKDFIDRHFQ